MKSGKIATPGQAGFALILALLALMMLTFLGLTLATTTSTELQIANNYRWGLQALYNAEAGIEVARSVFRDTYDRVGDPGLMILPVARTTPWDPDAPGATPAGPAPVPRFATATRNFEGGACDFWGNSAGMGAVLVHPNNPGAPFQNVSQVLGQQLRGTVTVWVRRDLVYNPDGTFADSLRNDILIVTAEGTAPYVGAGAFQRTNQAVRRLEARVSLTGGGGCGEDPLRQTSQTGIRGCID